MAIDIQLPDVWVYTLADYQRSFCLTDNDLENSILELPSALSSFNMQAHQLGTQVVSAAPIFTLDRSAFKHQVDEWLESAYLNLQMLCDREVISEEDANRYWVLWHRIAQVCLADYAQGRHERRYQFSGLVALPFESQQFSLAICVNAEEDLSEEFTERMMECLRVAQEVRVYPMPISDVADLPPQLLMYLQANDIAVVMEPVPPVLGGGEAMLCRFTRDSGDAK